MSEVPPPQAEVRFRVADAFEVIRRRWPGARLESHALGTGNDLTSEVLWAEPQQPDHWLVLTSGLHGIEGDVGAWYAQHRLPFMASMPGCIGARKLLAT